MSDHLNDSPCEIVGAKWSLHPEGGVLATVTVEIRQMDLDLLRRLVAVGS